MRNRSKSPNRRFTTSQETRHRDHRYSRDDDELETSSYSKRRYREEYQRNESRDYGYRKYDKDEYSRYDRNDRKRYDDDYKRDRYERDRYRHRRYERDEYIEKDEFGRDISIGKQYRDRQSPKHSSQNAKDDHIDQSRDNNDVDSRKEEQDPKQEEKPMELDQNELDEEEQMKILMGFGGFDSTKGKYIPDANDSATNAPRKVRKYKQFLNKRHIEEGEFG